MIQIMERNKKKFRSQPELSVSCLFSFFYCLSLGLTILWTHETVLCSNRWLHYIYSLEEEAVAGEACPGVGASDECFQLHL